MPVPSAVSTRGEAFDDALLRQRPSLLAERIGTMDAGELEAIEIAGGVRFGDERIELPAHWFPAGDCQRLSRRQWRWASMATDLHPVGSSGFEAARLAVLRALVAAWILPTRGSCCTKVLKPSSYVRQRVQPLLYLAREILAVEDTRPALDEVFSQLTDTQAQRAVAATAQAYAGGAPKMLRALDQLCARGAIKDWLPRATSLVPGWTGKGAPVPERSRRGAAPPTVDTDQPVPYQPLPDRFVSEAGWRALWLIENLGPVLIGCLAGLSDEDVLISMLRRSTLSQEKIHSSRAEIVKRYFSQLVDRDKFECLPFTLYIGKGRRGGRGVAPMTSWSPGGFEALMECATVLQGCHIFVVSLSMGARWSEVASLTRDCLSCGEADQGIDRAEGTTWKLVDKMGGTTRDWPLSPTAVNAIRQQVRLAQILSPHSNHLWVARGGAGQWGALHCADGPLARLAIATGTEALLEGSSFHSHRFRKTIARLAALALVGAPKILMDLFGHRSIEMTLHYILSDPGIAAEIEEVAKGMATMLGRQAVETAQDNGGPAAEALRAYLQASFAERRFGTDDIREVAEILTANGKAVALVRPGILCTKQPGQAGPCTQRVGHPDPSRCKVDCDHRLELAAARHDAERAIEQAVQMLRDPDVAENEMMGAFWLGQAKTHAARFRDLAARYANHPEFAELLCSGEGAAA